MHKYCGLKKQELNSIKKEEVEYAGRKDREKQFINSISEGAKKSYSLKEEELKFFRTKKDDRKQERQNDATTRNAHGRQIKERCSTPSQLLCGVQYNIITIVGAALVFCATMLTIKSKDCDARLVLRALFVFLGGIMLILGLVKLGAVWQSVWNYALLVT